MAQSDRCKEGTLIPNTFISIAPRAHLCESWMRENCTSSLSGGRRLAFGRLLRPDTVTVPLAARVRERKRFLRDRGWLPYLRLARITREGWKAKPLGGKEGRKVEP